jgi:valyl-tRNA synthetase
MEWWKKEGFFEPKFSPDGKVSKEGYFVIPIPPPNVTGKLHAGKCLIDMVTNSWLITNRTRT